MPPSGNRGEGSENTKEVSNEDGTRRIRYNYEFHDHQESVIN